MFWGWESKVNVPRKVQRLGRAHLLVLQTLSLCCVLTRAPRGQGSQTSFVRALIYLKGPLLKPHSPPRLHLLLPSP